MAEADSSSGWTEGRRLEGAKWERPRPGMVLEAGNRVEESEEGGGGGQGLELPPGAGNTRGGRVRPVAKYSAH
jgi:hypothetical protein